MTKQKKKALKTKRRQNMMHSKNNQSFRFLFY